jgi:CheY-like chemotaxis protein
MQAPITERFFFQAQELSQKLSQVSQGMLTGYWLFEFLATNQLHQVTSLYLSVQQGQVIFSGDRPLSWQSLLKAFQQYIPRLRSDGAKHSIARLEQQFILKASSSKLAALQELLSALYQLNLITFEEVTQSLRLKILADFDTYLFEYPGHAQFLPSVQLDESGLNTGFELQELLTEAQRRHHLWRRLCSQIPSMDSIPVLNPEAIAQSHLSIAQKQRLEELVPGTKTLNQIASFLMQDRLEIAKGFAQLISNGLISLKAPEGNTAPKIVIVDDSPLILRQFKSLVTHWGYQVELSQNPETALQTMLCAQPALIFLDINMPNVNGFELVKQIRRQPGLAAVPLIMLTGEKTLSNNWRAQWSGCKFLTKPLTPQEVPQFQMELRMLLEELAPLPVPNQQRTSFTEER